MKIDRLYIWIGFALLTLIMWSIYDKHKGSNDQPLDIKKETLDGHDELAEKVTGTKFTLNWDIYIWRDTTNEMSYTVLKKGKEIVVPNYKEDFEGYYLISYLGFPNYIYSNDLKIDNKKGSNNDLEPYSKEIIKMTRERGVYTIPCEVNGLKLKFIFDTGASVVTISLTEIYFMLKNDYLSEDDIKGSIHYQIANGQVEEGTIINLREIKIGKRVLKNVEATVVNSQNSPLLLGQSALSRIGKFSFDYSNNTLILDGEGNN